MTVRILIGDVRERLRGLPDAYFDSVVTSPPYWGLRDYGVAGQIGLERTLGEHLAVMVEVFREVRRVLKPRGTLWLNYGDCYAATPNGRAAADVVGDDRTFRDKPFSTVGPILQPDTRGPQRAGAKEQYRPDSGRTIRPGGFLKPKDLCMIPNRLAIALQDDGWWVRSEIIWHKPNPMPESVYDRPTSAHEKVWLLTKSEDYFYNHEAIREPCSPNTHARLAQNVAEQVGSLRAYGGSQPDRPMKAVARKLAAPGSGTKNNTSMDAALAIMPTTRNSRNVWTIAPRAYREAHFATFPPALAERCIRAGVPAQACGLCGHALPHPTCEGLCRFTQPVAGRVLDPFGGAGTVGLVADGLGLDATLIEINPEYAAMSARRIGPAAEIVGALAPLAVAAE